MYLAPLVMLVNTIIPKIYRFHVSTMLLFYIIQKENQVTYFSQSYYHTF